MDIRTPIKQALRMCGHAAVSTIHERLNGIERALQDILDQNTHIACTQTALLQSGVHLVEKVAELEAAGMREQLARKGDVETLAGSIEELRDALAAKSDVPQFAAELARVKAHMEAIETRLREQLADLLDQNTHIAGTQTAMLQSGVHLVAKLAELEAAGNRSAAYIQEQLASKTDADTLAGTLERLCDTMAAKPDVLQFAAELARVKAQIEAVETGIRQQNLESIEALKSGVEQIKEAGGAAVQAGIETMINLGQNMRDGAAASLALLEPTVHETKAFLQNQSVRQVCIETSDYIATNPEMGLLAFLYSFLPTRRALDIGAHTGDVSEHLVNAGYEVYAFEPYPSSYAQLTKRLSGRPEFHPFSFGLGSVTGDLPLHLVTDRSPDGRYEDATVFHSFSRHGMPTDLVFKGTVNVPVTSLADLHEKSLVPSDASLVKIDTEGFDLEVIRGMRDFRYPVVMVEFWANDIPFGGPGLMYTPESMAAEMRDRGYLWYIVIYRVWGRPETGFFCNHDRGVPETWGNMIFFRDREIFAEAQNWCSAVLPRVYFKHVPEGSGSRTATTGS
jgi:FkbM family methyltransferase